MDQAFNSTSRYLEDGSNTDNPYFKGMVGRIYLPELQLIKANDSDTEATFLDLHLSISNGFGSSKIYDKRDVFDFDIINFHFLDGEFPILLPTAFTFLTFRVVLGWAYRGLTGGFLLLQNFSVAISVSPHVCFILVLILISMFLR